MKQFHIAEYDEMAKQLDEIKEYSNFLPDVSTDDGYQKSKRVSLDIGKVKTSLEKARKAKKQYFLDGGKEVDGQAKAILEKLNTMQLPHMEAYKELDNLKKEREAKRKQDLEDRVFFIRNLPEMLSESSSDEIQGAMNEMQNEDCETFYEFTAVALKARNETQKLLAELFTKTVKSEKEAKELIELRKLQAEREQKERDDRVALEAKQKAEAVAKEQQDKIEKEKQEAIQREEQAKIAAEQSEQSRLAVEEQRKQDAIAAEVRAKLAAEQAEAKRLADIEQAKQAEIQRQQEQVKVEKQEAEKREANKKYLAKVHNSILSVLLDNGVNEPEAKIMIRLAAKGQLPQLTINY